MSEGLVHDEKGAVHTHRFVAEQCAGVSVADRNGNHSRSGSKRTHKKRESFDVDPGIGSMRRTGSWRVCGMVIYAGDKEEIL